jgi:hypothetical protein
MSMLNAQESTEQIEDTHKTSGTKGPLYTEHGSLFIAERLHLRSCSIGEASASLRLGRH